jgi:hypothetical protein
MTSTTRTRTSYSTVNVTGRLLGVDAADRDSRRPTDAADIDSAPAAMPTGPVDRAVVRMQPAEGAATPAGDTTTSKAPIFGRRSARRSTGSLRMRIDFCLAGSEAESASGWAHAADTGHELADPGMARIPA